jgi:outer membrane receptor protein involved in Fe transport
MKAILIVMVLFIGKTGVYAQERKVSLNLQNKSIVDFFTAIERQSRYNFIYSNDIVSDTLLVSISADRMTVGQVLEKVLPSKQLYYQFISERLIAISRKQAIGSVLANVKINVNGTITDQQSHPIPFASVSLLEGNVLLAGSISNEKGNYQLAHQFEMQRRYLLKISSMGYQSREIGFTYPDTLSIKRLALSEDRMTLKTVNVTGDKPLMERKADRYIVNVEGGILANGYNGMEVLQRSPGLWVKEDGSISIRGTQSVIVMINDVVQRMSSTDLAEFLRTLRSEDISKIEIISSPPSEFEAAGSGGIVHIILKKSRRDGLVGSIGAQNRFLKNYPTYSGDLSLNYKVKNLYLFGNTGAGREQSHFIASNEINYPNQDFYSSFTNRDNHNSRGRLLAGAAYDLSKNQSIGFQTLQTLNKLNQYFHTAVDFSGSAPLTGAATSEWYRRPQFSGTTVNYIWKIDSLGSGLKIIGDYVHSSKTELNNFASVYTLASKNSTFRNSTPNTTDLYSLQTDYTKVNKSFTFKTGLKFVSTKRDNEVVNENLIAGNWVLNTNLSNRFIYKEDLMMAYCSLEKNWKKWSAKAGLRAEYTHMNGNLITLNDRFTRDYVGLFPSVFITHKLNEAKGSSIYLSYARRLQRPSFADLNPYRLQFDDYLYQLGNPDLKPEYTHKMELGGLFWKGFSADIYYAHTVDKVAQFANPAGNAIEYQTRNFNNSNEFGFAFFAPIKLYKWWTINNAFTGYTSSYRINDYQISRNSFYISTQHDVDLKIFQLDLALEYHAPYVSANKKIADYFINDLGITKRFFDKKLRIRGYFADMFNVAREAEYINFQNTRVNFYQKRPTRNVSFSINYTFSSGKKFNSKKIEQSNDDEKRRIGN